MGDRDEEVVALFAQKGAFNDCSRGDDSDHFAPDEPLGELGILGLFGDGDSVAGGDEPVDVVLARVVGDAGHGDSLALSEGDLELPGDQLGVVVERFIEVAHSEEEEGSFGLFFATAPLGHHGGHRTLHFSKKDNRLGGLSSSNCL